MICITDKKVVKAASLIKGGDVDLVRPVWLFDALTQSGIDVGKLKALLPFEPRHMFFVTPHNRGQYEKNVDRYGDSYARNVGADELRVVFKEMETDSDAHF